MAGLYFDEDVSAYSDLDLSQLLGLPLLFETIEQHFGRLNLFFIDKMKYHSTQTKITETVSVARFFAMRGRGRIRLAGHQYHSSKDEIAICNGFDLSEYFLSGERRIFFRPSGVIEIAVAPPLVNNPDHTSLTFRLAGVGGKVASFPITQENHREFTVGFVKSHRYPEVLSLQGGILKKRPLPGS